MLSSADTEKLVAIMSEIVEIEPMYYDGEWIVDSERICFFCGGLDHKADCPWLEAKQLLERVKKGDDNENEQ